MISPSIGQARATRRTDGGTRSKGGHIPSGGPVVVAGEDPETSELKRSQIQRAREERKREDEAIDEEEAETHGRRAEKSDYLREKLEERAEAERQKLEGRDEG